MPRAIVGIPVIGVVVCLGLAGCSLVEGPQRSAVSLHERTLSDGDHPSTGLDESSPSETV